MKNENKPKHRNSLHMFALTKSDIIIELRVCDTLYVIVLRYGSILTVWLYNVELSIHSGPILEHLGPSCNIVS